MYNTQPNISTKEVTSLVLTSLVLILGCVLYIVYRFLHCDKNLRLGCVLYSMAYYIRCFTVCFTTDVLFHLYLFNICQKRRWAYVVSCRQEVVWTMALVVGSSHGSYIHSTWRDRWLSAFTEGGRRARRPGCILPLLLHCYDHD